MSIQVLDFMIKPDPSVSNYQRAVVRFRREPELIPLGAYMASMEIIADDSIGTAATDCVRKIWYSPKYFNSMSVDQCTTALSHEVYHKLLNFFPRFERWSKKYKGQYTRKELCTTFNIAQDYFVNWILKHQWKMELGDGWIYDQNYTIHSHTTESIADDLIRKGNMKPPPPPEGDDTEPCGDEEGDDTGSDPDKCDGDGPSEEGDEPDDEGAEGEAGEGDQQQEGDGSSEPAEMEAGRGDDIKLPEEYDGDIENELTEQEISSIEAENRQDMSNALRAAKGYDAGKGKGKDDPFTAEAVESAYKTGFDFYSELMRHANKATNTGKYTWFRPNRRLKTNQGLALPSRRGKVLGTAVFIIDSSGSTDGDVVRFFLDNVTDALRNLDYEKAVVIWCSDAVPRNGIQEFTKKEAESGKSMFDGIIRRAGCGTNLPPAFEVVVRDYPDARCITYLTDGGVGEYDVTESKEIMADAKLSSIPVLWLLIDDTGYEYVQRFVEWTKDHNFGRCAFLPMDKIE